MASTVDSRHGGPEPAPHFRLVCDGVYGRTIFDLPEGTSRLGRNADLEVVLDDSEVSGHHAEIEVRGAACLLRDTNSLNGVYVNERRIDEAVLKPGDQFDVGGFTFALEVVKPYGPAEGQRGPDAARFRDEAARRRTLRVVIAAVALLGALLFVLLSSLRDQGTEPGGASTRSLAEEFGIIEVLAERDPVAGLEALDALGKRLEDCPDTGVRERREAAVRTYAQRCWRQFAEGRRRAAEAALEGTSAEIGPHLRAAAHVVRASRSEHAVVPPADPPPDPLPEAAVRVLHAYAAEQMAVAQRCLAEADRRPDALWQARVALETAEAACEVLEPGAAAALEAMERRLAAERAFDLAVTGKSAAARVAGRPGERRRHLNWIVRMFPDGSNDPRCQEAKKELAALDGRK